MSSYGAEFQEIGHCGGQFTINVKTIEGRRGYQFGFKNSSPTRSALFAIYAMPPGIPVGPIQLGGIGAPWNPSPMPGGIPVFVGSDSEGRFGHQCPKCKGYWRSGGASSRWRLTCPYCGLKNVLHHFLTDGQRRYVTAWCDLFERALESDHDGEHAINMDDAARETGKETTRPAFYYAEESQQNKYDCAACGEFNDILGRYGYCSNCGTHNGIQELEKDLNAIRGRINNGGQNEACVKDAVSAFDSYARQLAKQLVARIPMTQARRNEWERRKFHALQPRANSLKDHFDINILNRLSSDDVVFVIRMFHRRHLYEHNGGEVDQKYLIDSGDTSVRLKQKISETADTAKKITDLVLQMAKNLSNGFHEIFSPEEEPIKMKREQEERMRKRNC